MKRINGDTVLGIDDREYPEKLRMIQNPPEKIYLRGNIELLEGKSIAVVGSRKCSEYGKITAMKIGKACALNDTVLISGMALGIDGFSHEGAIRNNGKTIAVLGCGVDICYPRSNRKIYERICEDGLVISEYPHGTEPAIYTFPQRNRIISALSDAVVVVEAGTHSGSLITADYGREQGKEVFAVPGNISSQYSFGTNNLIAQGARPVVKIEDIFMGLDRRDIIGFNRQADEIELEEEEQIVFDFIRQMEECSMDELCEKSEIPLQKLSGIVGMLELKEAISYRAGKLFVAKY